MLAADETGTKFRSTTRRRKPKPRMYQYIEFIKRKNDKSRVAKKSNDTFIMEGFIASDYAQYF